MVLSIIENGYIIPFEEEPPQSFFRNNKSALHEVKFVADSVLELLASGRIQEKIRPSFIVSPLSVACSSSKKNRLILDLSFVNKYIVKNHFKLDDWKLGIQFLSENALMISFDLKSGYHHVDIAPVSQRFLGFSWSINGVDRYFEFTVLPFGLTTAPFIFTKVLKPLVSHWRSCGILIALYLDDGFIVIPRPEPPSNHSQLALDISNRVRSDLLEAGFIYNISKSNWSPVSSIDWLGMKWDTIRGTLQVLDRKIEKKSRHL